MRQKIAEIIDLFFGFRKFILMSMLFAIAIVFRLYNQINGTEFVDLLKNTAIAFFATNGLEHITTTVREYVGAKAAGAAQVVADVSEGGSK